MLPETNMQQILSLMETIQELMMGYELTDVQYEELRTAWYDVDDSFELSRPMSELEEMERELFDHFYHVEYEDDTTYSFSQDGETLFHVEYPCEYSPEYGTGDVKITTGVFTEEDIKELAKPKGGIIYAGWEDGFYNPQSIVEDFIFPNSSGGSFVETQLGKPDQVLIVDGEGQIKWVDHEGTLFDPEYKSSTETLTIIGAFDDAMKVVDD